MVITAGASPRGRGGGKFQSDSSRVWKDVTGLRCAWAFELHSGTSMVLWFFSECMRSSIEDLETLMHIIWTFVERIESSINEEVRLPEVFV